MGNEIDRLAVLVELAEAFGDEPLPNFTIDITPHNIWFHDTPERPGDYAKEALAVMRFDQQGRRQYASLGDGDAQSYANSFFKTLAELAALVAADFKRWRTDRGCSS
jgi:hypothetical protein